jgi:glycosyltransferase involved in cell wall biosynthesis
LGLLAEITAVSLAETDPETLVGRHIDFPVPGCRTEAFAFEVMGWVLAKDGPAVAVEVLANGRVLRRVPLGFPRPDLADAFPDAPGAASAGFGTHFNLLGMGPDIELRVRAILGDRTRIDVGVIRARLGWRVAGDDSLARLVSVVIPCYRQAHFLPETIESVLAQTYPHHEIVVVNDGSTDNAGEVAARYPGVRCITQENAGLAAARNSGIRHTNGDFLVFLDADDRLLPRALELGLEGFRDRPEAAFVAGSCRRIASDGTSLSGRPAPCEERDPYVWLLRKNGISMPGAVMYRRSVFEWVRGFADEVSPAADYDLYLRIAKDFAIHCHDETIAEYRVHGSSMSGNASVMLPATVAVLRSQRRSAMQRRESREAWKEGMRFTRRYYRSQAVDDTRFDMSRRRWRSALRNVLVLARYDRRGLVSLLRSR